MFFKNNNSNQNTNQNNIAPNLNVDSMNQFQNQRFDNSNINNYSNPNIINSSDNSLNENIVNNMQTNQHFLNSNQNYIPNRYQNFLKNQEDFVSNYAQSHDQYIDQGYNNSYNPNNNGFNQYNGYSPNNNGFNQYNGYNPNNNGFNQYNPNNGFNNNSNQYNNFNQYNGYNPNNNGLNQFQNNKYNNSEFDQYNRNKQMFEEPKEYKTYEDFALDSQKNRAANEYGRKFVEKGKLPKELNKEVKREIIRCSIFFTVGMLFLIYSLINLYSIYTKNSKFLGIDITYYRDFITPNMFFLVIITIASLAILFFSIADFSSLMSNVKKCKNKAINQGRLFIPHFVTRNYRKLITRYIYMNWIGFSIYFISGISLGILYLLQSCVDHGNTQINFLFWTMGSLNKNGYNQDIIIFYAILIVALLVHIFSIIDSRIRKANIINLYEAEIITPDEAQQLRKTANRRCLITFIVIIILLIIIFYIVYYFTKSRKSSEKKGFFSGLAIWPKK